MTVVNENEDLEMLCNIDSKKSFFPLSQELLDDMNSRSMKTSPSTKELIIFIKNFVSSFESGNTSIAMKALGRLSTFIETENQHNSTMHLEEFDDLDKDESFHEEAKHHSFDSNSKSSFVNRNKNDDDESMNDWKFSKDFMQENNSFKKQEFFHF